MECKVFNGVIDKKTQCFEKKGISGLGTFTYDCEESDIEFKSIHDIELDNIFNK